MRPEQKAPDNATQKYVARYGTTASMRPEQKAPDNAHKMGLANRDAGASMRPEQKAPDNLTPDDSGEDGSAALQ